MPESKAESISNRRRKRQIDVDRDANEANSDANDANLKAKLTLMEVRALDVIKADTFLSEKKTTDKIHVSRSIVQ